MTDWTIKNFSPLISGKVRNVYAVPDREDLLFILTTDAISAFDRVVGEVPERGVILNRMSNYWKGAVGESIIKSDIFLTNPKQCLEMFGIKNLKKYNGRVMLVKRARALPIECIVRGYICGSLWKDYQSRQRVAGSYLDNHLPANLLESEELPMPIFTPTTKAPKGQHDEPLAFAEMSYVLKEWLRVQEIDLRQSNYFNARILAEKIRSVSLEIYCMASRLALEKGIIIADTKFEFGLVWNDNQNLWELRIIDEVLTPDSSRFWARDGYVMGKSQNSFDKQVLRDWLTNNPGEKLPDFLISSLYELYSSAYELICK
ncbi:MAG: phosphoribosylaminoimidazolesuccinocarboxamide synthase [Candidatus Pacebacteria bacterium]|nr:phosphoribosylaminoimidazolesuccinocarboxamide synthase [Candidatus Paceibacterota bacterium]